MRKEDRIQQAIEVVREVDAKRVALLGQPVSWRQLCGDENGVERHLHADLDVLEFLDIFEAFGNEQS
jgi:hypothetical protein